MIEDRLYDALLYTWWLETENYIRSMRSVFNKTLPLVMRYYVPGQLREKARARLSNYGYTKENGELTPEVYVMARKLYRALATKLGDKDYFFGSSPSSLDAVAFGHLSLHCYPSLANPKLFSMLSFEFPTIIAYCNRIRTHLFSEPPRKSPMVQPSWRENIANFWKSPSTQLNAFWSNIAQRFSTTRDETPPSEIVKKQRLERFYTILSVVGGLAFFVGYIVHNEIIQIRIEDEDEDEDEDVEELGDVEDDEQIEV
ncbi:Metaxin-3 [Quaeritorhiza haematococci]|nr:Metaxin-3 [Quaeritorhiza haematococci]